MNPVPSQVKLASEWSWRLITIALAVFATVYGIIHLALLFGVIFASLVATAILLPLRRVIEKTGLNHGLSTGAAVIIGLLAMVAAFTLVINALQGQATDIGTSVRDGVDQIRDRLRTGPLQLTDKKIDQYIDQVSNGVSENRSIIITGVAGATSTAIEIVSGLFLTLFTTIFFLHDGDKIWKWCVNLFPRGAHEGLDEAGNRSGSTFTGYVRGTLIIALVDAVIIGIGIALVGVPLALPLAVLIFFGAFVPIVGALVSGFVAVAVALATQGVWPAVIVLIVIFAVQQLEGHILQPVVMGHSVHLHPLAIVLTVAAGSTLAGIPGAIVAVPIAAIANTALGYYGHRARDEQTDIVVEHENGELADKPT